MWCYIKGIECYKHYCDGCYPYNFPINQQFNYECPDCKGKFNYVSYSYLEGSCQSQPCCPFCGRIMEGLK